MQGDIKEINKEKSKEIQKDKNKEIDRKIK